MIDNTGGRTRSARALLVILVIVGAACSASEDTDTVREERTAPPRGQEDPGGEAGVALERRPPKALAPSEWVQGSPERDSVLLAFNGPLAAADLDSVLDELDATDAKAAFFIRGHWADAHPAAMEALSESGHVVGNAGRRKALKPSAPPKRLRSMIRKGERSLLRRGVDPRPFLSFDGRADRRSLRVAGALGYRSVRPSVWGGRGGPKKVVRRVMARVRPGSIVELRGERSAHVAALATILRRVERAGLGTQSLESLTRTSPVRWDVVLAAGANGRRVRALQKELAADTYPAGPADGTFGTATLDAVYAFEKVNGLTLDGAIDGADMERLLRGGPPDPPPHPEDTYIDIDITRQVLFEVRNGEVVHTVPVSTGNGAAYESRGTTAIASTPRGSFEIYNKIPGWRISHLGALYYPSYFSGGYAIHGSTSVPPYPASHGCVRIPMHVAIEFYERNDYGTPVYVHD